MKMFLNKKESLIGNISGKINQATKVDGGRPDSGQSSALNGLVPGLLPGAFLSF